jgi:hypothetical protein
MKGYALKMRIATAVLSVAFGATMANAQTTDPWPVRGNAGSVEVGVEAITSWLRDTPVPVPLVTNLIVGSPATQTYLGGQDLSVGASGGLRIFASYALSDRSALEGNVFFIPYRSTSRSVSSSGLIGSVNLIVPYLDAETNRENGTEISYAPLYAGTAQEEYSVGMLGAEFNGAWALAPSSGWTFDALGGFRYLRLRETYTFTTSSPYVAPYPAGVWDTTDRFETTNNFYGLQAGLRARYDQGAFFGTGVAKVALGAMVEEVNISGSLVTDEFTNHAGSQAFAGGYFALPSNIGNYSRTTFAVVPEVALRLGYRVTPAASIFVGYSFLYASNVVRPGNQIDRTINTSQSTAYTEDPRPVAHGTARPSFSFNDSAFWAQSVSLGFAYRF